MNLDLTPKQYHVLNLIQKKAADEILYGGAAGGGKSWLLRALAIIWAIQVPGIQIFLFRRKVKDLIATHMRGSSSFPILLKEYVDDKLCKINTSSNVIEFDNHSNISLNHLQYESDLDNYLSSEIHILLLDESTTFTEKMVRFLRGRMRIGSLPVPMEFRGCLPFAVYATNPRGVSHVYFKKRFVDANVEGEPFIAPENDGGMKRVFIKSMLKDNPHVEKGYASKLKGLGDPDVVEAYLAGDWSVVEGAALPRLNRLFHMVRPQFVCESWPVYRAYDYGYSAPYFYANYRIATGESSTNWCPPKGSIVWTSNIYGANEDDKGLKEDVAITAKKMYALELEKYGQNVVRRGPADNAIFDKEQGPSIASQISQAVSGLEFKRSNKNPGSRILGLAEIRKFLYNAMFHRHERPGMYFTTDCKNHFDQLQNLEMSEKTPEDVDTDGNDHSYDVTRYVALDHSNFVIQINYDGA